jgi:catechol 2,3-dioxygenase-like lactoylglutathione lyase family enzyme
MSSALRLAGICLDCADAEEMARFYATLLGWEVVARDTPETRKGGSGWVAIADPAGGVGLSFQGEEWYEPPVWPEEPGAPSKMMHFEMAADDLDAAIALAIEAGARVAPHQPADRADDPNRIMLDPAGHPFCLGGPGS